MKTHSWKTTLGGSLSALGTAIAGIAIVPSLTNMESAENLKWLVITGLALQAFGTFFGHLFAVDEKSIKTIVDKRVGETTTFSKADVKP